jgi:hypothetical protein
MSICRGKEESKNGGDEDRDGGYGGVDWAYRQKQRITPVDKTWKGVIVSGDDGKREPRGKCLSESSSCWLWEIFPL